MYNFGSAPWLRPSVSELHPEKLTDLSSFMIIYTHTDLQS